MDDSPPDRATQAETQADKAKLEVVFTLPEGYRPASEQRFPAQSEGGWTIVVVKPDGSVLADPTVGWINLDAISFQAAKEQAPPAG